MNAIQRFFFNIFLFCFGFGFFLFFKLDSYADDQAILSYRVDSGDNYYLNENIYSVSSNPNSEDVRLAFYVGQNTFYLVSNVRDLTISRYNYVDGYNSSGNIIYSNSSTNYLTSTRVELGGYSFYRYDAGTGVSNISASPRYFSDFEQLNAYINLGELPQISFNDSLELDSFKVTSWTFGNLQLIFKSKFVVEWSDPRISTVQVILSSTNGRVSFESTSSPFKQKFEPENYVLKKGDVVHLVATPYMSDGTYGVSLYQSFVYSDDVPGSNVYRKFTNTPYNDNTLTIPYTGVSGQPQSVTLPVDGVTTNNVYKVHYNPITYEYGDMNVYEIYYSPVVVYPEDTSDQEVEETQEVVNNTYTTNNYYETTKNININFDVSFGDISGSDIQHGFDDFGNFGNGFGSFIGKLSSWVLALFPFLSPVVASAIVVMFGLILLLAIIALVLKIASVVADLIPF